MCVLAALDLHRGRLDLRCLGTARLCDAARQRREFHRLQEADQLRPVRRLENEIVEPLGDWNIVLQSYQLA